MHWVPLQRHNLPITSAAAKLYEDLRSDRAAAGINADIINLGQGREYNMPCDKILSYLTGTIEPSAAYTGKTGGCQLMRKTVSAWAKRFFGVEANESNTFLLSQLGRQGLFQAMQLSTARTYKAGRCPSVLVPSLSWPVVNDLAIQMGMDTHDYDVLADNTAQAIVDTGMLHSPELSAVYMNYPHNPTGRHISADEQKQVMDVLDDTNFDRSFEQRVWRIEDNPYFAACQQDITSDTYLETGYHGVLTENSITPWVVVISFSKALGMAGSGLTLLIVHPKLAQLFESTMTMNGIGWAYAPAYYKHMIGLFSSEMDSTVLNHFKSLKVKYRQNRSSLEDAFSDDVITGGAAMTSLVRVPKTIFKSKTKCRDGVTRQICNMADVMEFLANEMGVVVVDGGGSLAQGNALVRVAQAQDPELFNAGIARIKEGLNILSASMQDTSLKHANKSNLRDKERRKISVIAA